MVGWLMGAEKERKREEVFLALNTPPLVLFRRHASRRRQTRGAFRPKVFLRTPAH